MGRKASANNGKGRKQKQKRNNSNSNSNSSSINSRKDARNKWNFVAQAGPGCYIARRDLTPQPSWIIEWEDVDPAEFRGEEVPEVAVDIEERTLSLCNIEPQTQVAYVTVYDVALRGRDKKLLQQGSTTDNQGITAACTTFIILCPPRVFLHLCYFDLEDGHDISQTRIESDVREWNQHPNPTDEHPLLLGPPLADNGPFLCTQSKGGALTHFFSGNLHAIDFACPIGTPLLAVHNGVVTEVMDGNTLTGIGVSNLFTWNSIMLEVDSSSQEATKGKPAGPLFVEYVHIQKAAVKVGDKVTRGQIIGTSGSVGFSPEPHLHFSAFRSKDPNAPTVRVRFQSPATDGKVYLPSAGCWYNHFGIVEPKE